VKLPPLLQGVSFDKKLLHPDPTWPSGSLLASFWIRIRGAAGVAATDLTRP
jgi:hypothetical protein